LKTGDREIAGKKSTKGGLTPKITNLAKNVSRKIIITRGERGGGRRRVEQGEVKEKERVRDGESKK